MSSSGEVLYYGTFNQTVSLNHSQQRNKINSSLKRRGNALEVKLDLRESSVVMCEVVSLSGRRVAVLLNKEMPSGAHTTVLQMGTPTSRIASGMYLLSLSVGGVRVAQDRLFIQRSGGNAR